MRAAIIGLQFNKLGVYQDQAHFLRGSTIQKTRDDAVDAHRLTAAGGACNQQVGHIHQIAQDWCAGNILAKGNCCGGFILQHLGRMQHLRQEYRGRLVVGNLNAN